MGLKSDVESFASAKGIALREYQKSNVRNIERDYDNKKIDKDKAVALIAHEIKKEGRLLSSSEQRELKNKIK